MSEAEERILQKPLHIENVADLWAPGLLQCREGTKIDHINRAVHRDNSHAYLVNVDDEPFEPIVKRVSLGTYGNQPKRYDHWINQLSVCVLSCTALGCDAASHLSTWFSDEADWRAYMVAALMPLEVSNDGLQSLA